jgi:flagellar biosynthesis protein
MSKYSDKPKLPQKKLAVALKYDGQGAPRVSAKGSGKIAERILELAEEHGIPLQEDHELVELLSQIELGHEIPENLYLAAAEVIAFAYRLKEKTLDQDN